MSSHSEIAAQYWGYLIQRDKQPTPVFQQLLLGVANYINKHITPWDTSCLTPVKLAHFYRLVGGDYDALFLNTPQTSLSFIYQSLGCFHTLQPTQDPFAAPSVPALTPQGFVRWQTVQLLLGPEEHVPFLQEAVKRFDLTNPTDGEPFPSILPRDALPSKPDQEMSEWHDAVSEKLMLEAQASQDRNLPPRPPMALSDGDLDSSRPTSADSYSVESQSIVDAATYFRHPRSYAHPPRPPPPPFVNTTPIFRAPPPFTPAYDAPWSPLHRRSSFPDQRPPPPHPASWPHSPHAQSTYRPSPPRRLQTRTRTPSTLSSSSYSSSSSSVTTSSASLSPVRYHTHLPPSSQAQADWRNSMGRDMPLNRTASHPPTEAYSSHPQHPAGMGPAPNTRGFNVKWPDQEQGSGWSTPKSGQGWSNSAHNGNGMTDSGVSRARSVGARPLVGNYSGKGKEDRAREERYSPRGSRGRR
ncbi:MAG: hypothetical protein Q9217_006092 [Psora testacea]